MEIKIGIAKTKKYAVSHSGDCCEIAERPHGGISAVLADGQGSGLSAHHTSSWVVNKAVSLIMDGARDGAVARAVHDYLYAMKDRKVSCTLTVLSADLETETIVISRNSNCPVIVKTEEYLSIYDEEVAVVRGAFFSGNGDWMLCRRDTGCWTEGRTAAGGFCGD